MAANEIHLVTTLECGMTMDHDTSTLYGSAPDKCGVCLLVIDVINDLDFPDAEKLLDRCLPMADRLSKLIDHARSIQVPVVYVNDNFGRWRSDFRAQVEHCLKADGRGRPIV